jgi:hypothetical protein
VTIAHRDDAFADGAVPEAYTVISSLLDGIVGRLAPPFTLAKLEGDAVFAYAEDDDAPPRGRAMLDCIFECHADFRSRLDNAHEVWTCWCDACKRIDELNLKFVLHAGTFVVQDIAGRSELVGPEVVVVHRLLKSGAAELVGHPAYALVTESAAAILDIPADGALELVDMCDGVPVASRVFPLGSEVERPPAL